MKTRDEQAERSLSRAICNLLAGDNAQPFFASLCMELTRQEVDKDWFAKQGMAGNETAAVDGKKFYFYAPFINSLSEPLRKSLVVHEVWHCALGHCWRRGARHSVLWNIAADYVVNGLIKTQCGLPIGPNWLRNAKYDGLGVEQVYDLLLQKSKDGDGGQERQVQGPGEVIDAQAVSGADPQVLEKEWQVKLVNAANLHRGELPAAFKSLVSEILTPKVDWRTLLRRFVQGVAKSDYSWTRPDRRHVWQGLHLPSLRSDQVGHIAFALDVSGSTREHWGQFLDEAESVLSEVQPEKLTLVQADCAIGKREEYQPGDSINREIVGGGGSSTLEVFKALNEDYEQPVCLVYLTDGWIEFPKEAPSYPVLWIITTEVTPEFGEVIRI